jgi:hypothetical protein
MNAIQMKNSPKHDDDVNIWKALGVPAPRFEDERYAPPLDERLVRAYVRNELTREQAEKVDLLALRFRSWSKATSDMAMEELVAKYGSGRLQEE